ncbi:hypothetical protein E4U42_006671 [Claviceps africana]|uniref:Uncharacterized protein n=1 Tax=Claviceps africana TaxID=83212 RepID=A0A8K0JDR3_9HYPO|nr:hypothetical protein E4U42_006671 [Claviceps africana]
MDDRAEAPADMISDDAPMDEVQLAQAMKRLKLLYVKARLLRDTIPKILEPLVQKQPSHNAADALFNGFVKAVTDAQSDIREFTELMTDEKSKQNLIYVQFWN